MQIFSAMNLKNGAKAEPNKMGTMTQPVQFLPEKEKDDQWRAHCLDWLEWQGLKQLRRNARRLSKNYKLAKGIIDKTDYIIEEDNEMADLIDTLTKEDTSALELKFYPIIPNVINVLCNEFSKHNLSILPQKNAQFNLLFGIIIFMNILIPSIWLFGIACLYLIIQLLVIRH
jgi:hypothetical protein